MDVSALLEAPRLVGRPLEWLAAASGQRLVAQLVLQQMARQAGIQALRRLRPRTLVPWTPQPAARLQRRSMRAPVQVRRAQRLSWPCERCGDALALHAAYDAGRTRPDQVARGLLERIDADNGTAHWFIEVQPDDVLAQAQASAQRWEAGHALGPLDGVPVAVKDEFDVRGYTTTLGTVGLGRPKASSDAVAVRRLRDSGAILAGKANMHEFGAGVTGINPHYGTPRNPWDPARMPGGSSSGCAAAVAAGVVPLALAADAGGSIRIPAALCGVVGLKPTFGRVGRAGQAELGFTLGHVGVIGATTRDALLGLAAVAGYDVHDATSRWGPPLDLDARFRLPAPLRVAFDPAWTRGADAAVQRVFETALDALREAGADLIEVTVPHTEHLFAMHLATFASEVAAAPEVLEPPAGLAPAPDVRLIAAVCRVFPGADTVHAGRLRADLVHDVDALLDRCHALLTPATACAAPVVPADALATGELYFERTERLMRYAVLANLTGHPAVVVPAGVDANGLPVAVQLVGARWSEVRLLGVAAQLEAALSPGRAPEHRPLL